MYGKMPGKSNFFPKGLGYIKKGYNKIKFGLFGTSLALPALLFNNCKGSCSSCFGCLVSGTPIAILIILLIYRKFSPLRYLKQKLHI